MADTNALFMAEHTYKIGVTFCKSIQKMHILVALFDNGARINLMYSALIPPK